MKDPNDYYEEPALNPGRVLTWRGKEQNDGHPHYPTGTKVVLHSVGKSMGSRWYLYLEPGQCKCIGPRCGGWNRAQFVELYKPPKPKEED